MTTGFFPLVKRSFMKLLSNSIWAISLVWKKEPRLSWAVVAIQISHIFLPAAVAFSSRNIINQIVSALETGELNSTLVNGILLNLSLILLSGIAVLTGQYANNVIKDRLNLLLTLDMLDHASKLDFPYFEDTRFQDVLERAQASMSNHLTKFTILIFDASTDFFQLASLIVILVFIEPLMAPATLLLIIPYLIAQMRLAYARYSKDFDRTTKRRWTTYFASHFISRVSVPEIRFFNLGPLMRHRFNELMSAFVAQDLALHIRDWRINAAFYVAAAVFFFFLLVRVSEKVLGGASTIGDFTIFLGAVATIRVLVKNLVTSGSRIIEEALFVDDSRTFFELESKETVRPTDQTSFKMDSVKGRLEFRDVSFTYPGSKTRAISNISFAVDPGETVALVGENGSGKSTTIKLISRLYKPDSGEILLDGKSIYDYDLEEYYKNITVKVQDFNRYEATAQENIAYGNWTSLLDEEDQVKKIISELEMEDFFAEMPDGMQTLLGRRFGDYDLSGGQWQKIAVARAFTRKTPLLILDEPTSGIDIPTEYKLFARFKELTTNQTVILISHRFSTLSHADKILVFDKGKLIEAGSHQELLERDGHYAYLYGLTLISENRDQRKPN